MSNSPDCVNGFSVSIRAKTLVFIPFPREDPIFQKLLDPKTYFFFQFWNFLTLFQDPNSQDNVA